MISSSKIYLLQGRSRPYVFDLAAGTDLGTIEEKTGDGGRYALITPNNYFVYGHGQDHRRGTVKLAVAIAAVLALNLAGSFLIKLMARLGPDPFRITLPFVLIGGAVLVVAALRVFGWLLLGRYFQLSFIHPFLSLNYVIAVFLGMAAFDEPFAWNRLVGGVIITASVLMLTRSKHQREPGHDSGATGGMF